MCGIFSIISDHDVTNQTLQGLKRLEYRGYDSAGIGGLVHGMLEERITVGTIDQLKEHFDQQAFQSDITISHTRWATHGAVCLQNTHPIMSKNKDLMVVHNGIIENYKDILKKYQFGTINTETDSESILHYCLWHRNQNMPMDQILQHALKDFVGSYAFLLLDPQDGSVWCVKQGIPLTLGISYKDESLYLASDILSMSKFATEFSMLNNNIYGVFKPHLDFKIFNEKGHPVSVQFEKVQEVYDLTENHDFPHHTLKEIHDQPVTMVETMENYIDFNDSSIHFPQHVENLIKNQSAFMLTGCGAAYYAANLGAYWLRNLANVDASSYLAPEMRYEPFLMHHPSPVIVLSQSGETKDVLLTAEDLLKGNRHIIPIVNVPNSTLSRFEQPLYTLAFPEIGVTTTKAFSAQVLTLYILALFIGKQNNPNLSTQVYKEHIQALKVIPHYFQQILQHTQPIQHIAKEFEHISRVFFIARGDLLPIAREAALKLKEIAYLDVTAYSATEMKHGPIALIDEHLLAIILIPFNQFFHKTVSNMQEILVRGGRIVAITDQQGMQDLYDIFQDRIIYLEIPDHKLSLSPFVYILCTQLLCYYMAAVRGKNIDQPKNLAKSVTVE